MEKKTIGIDIGVWQRLGGCCVLNIEIGPSQNPTTLCGREAAETYQKRPRTLLDAEVTFISIDFGECSIKENSKEMTGEAILEKINKQKKIRSSARVHPLLGEWTSGEQCEEKGV